MEMTTMAPASILCFLLLICGTLSSQEVPPAVNELQSTTTLASVTTASHDLKGHKRKYHTETAVSSTVTTMASLGTVSTEDTPSKWRDTHDEGGRQKAALMALHYIEQHRKPDWGWGNDTHRAIVALQFVNDTKNEVEASQPNVEMQLSTKQLEIEMLLLLWKHRETPISSRQLASYTLALVSLCHDPRDFHSHDLVGVLLHREPAHAHDLALTSLAACAAGARARRRHVRRLLDAASAQAEHNIDTMSMVILALRCIIRDHRHRSLQPFLRRPLAGLARQQLPDGSFGTSRGTALAIQALEDAENGSQQLWNESAALQWLMRQQGPQGGFGDMQTTVEAALALSGAVVAAPKRCPHSDLPPFDAHDPSDTYPKVGGNGVLRHYNESDARNVSFTYTLWIGTNVTDNYTLFMTAPRNISFYHVMQMASEQDPHFEFSASDWPNGHYVHTLAGCREEPMGYHYWLLYRLPEQPDPNNPPGNQLVAPVGVDDLLVEEGEHYLFWYKKL